MLTPIVRPTANDPWSLDPDRTTRHHAVSIAPPVNLKPLGTFLRATLADIGKDAHKNARYL